MIADLEAARKIAADREVTLRDTVNEVRASLVQATSRAEAAADATNEAHQRALEQHRSDVEQARIAARELESEMREQVTNNRRLARSHLVSLLLSAVASGHVCTIIFSH